MQMMVLDLKTIFWKDHINLTVFGKQKKKIEQLEKDTRILIMIINYLMNKLHV